MRWVVLLFLLAAACSDDDYGKDLGFHVDMAVNTDGFDLAANNSD